MRVLAITNMYPMPHKPAFGIYIEQQVKGLRAIGVKVNVLYLNRDQEGTKVYRNLKVPVCTEITTYKPDIVHIMYGGIMADRITKIVVNRPTVVTFHGSDVLGQQLSGPVRKLISHFGVWSSRRAACRADGVVAVSKVIADALPQACDRSRIRIIPCGIDLDRFKPMNSDDCKRKLRWRNGALHVLFSTNYRDQVKRPELAQAAVRLLNLRGVEAEIHQLTDVANEEVPFWLNASDVLILTSMHEGSPTIVKEALACNLPVVSVDVGDVAERLAGIDGCHIALPNPDHLADKLALVEARRKRLSARDAVTLMSLESVAVELQTFYRDILASFISQNRA